MNRRAFTLLLASGCLYRGGFLAAAPEASDTVRVRLFAIERPPEIQIMTGSSPGILINSRTNIPFHSSGPISLLRPGFPALRLACAIDVSSSDGQLRIIAELPLDEYVAAVLAGESLSFRSPQSLKALAVAVRSYALHFRHRHQQEGFDFCDTTHCQDFRISAVNDRLRSAAVETQGQVLVYDLQPIAAYYQKNCGGITEGQGAYLPRLNDRYCSAHGRMHWMARVSGAELASTLGTADVNAVEIAARTESGRARSLRINGEQTIAAEGFRLSIGRKIGWDRIRSDLYSVRRESGGFVFDGFGSGHGLGLCQDGAAAMGEQGLSYRDILAYYYPNTILT